MGTNGRLAWYMSMPYSLDLDNGYFIPSLFSQVSSFIGILFMVGVFLTLFSAIGGYPKWVGPLVMIGLMAILFAIPLPILYYRSRLWLANVCVSLFAVHVLEIFRGWSY